MKTEILSAVDPRSLDLAYVALQKSKLVAFPTDTVYGVGALAFDPRGICKLYFAKDRITSKAIPILVGSPNDLNLVTSDVNPLAWNLAKRFWPGALTLVVPRHPDLPTEISPYSTIGVRMPNHPVALALLERFGPLAVTSANLSGNSNTCTAEDVYDQLNGRISIILDGGITPGGTPSTVVDCTGPKPIILRPGPITLQDLE
jgi:L-threonylcarbamoyladenylate synthase